MAALDVNDWTVTVTDRWIKGKKRHAKGTLALAGTDTYPTGGVPLPTAQSLGLVRNLEELKLTGQRGAAITKYLENVDYTRTTSCSSSSRTTPPAPPRCRWTRVGDETQS